MNTVQRIRQAVGMAVFSVVLIGGVGLGYSQDAVMPLKRAQMPPQGVENQNKGLDTFERQKEQLRRLNRLEEQNHRNVIIQVTNNADFRGWMKNAPEGSKAKVLYNEYFLKSATLFEQSQYLQMIMELYMQMAGYERYEQ